MTLAGPEDDADLRDVLARTPMGGVVRLSFRREPSYFAGSPIDGDPSQVMACREGSGRVVGLGVRSLRRMYVNGVAERVGYLSALRLLKEHRGQGLAKRAYGYLRELHGDGAAALYLTTIAVGNAAAMAFLTTPRPGMPAYHPSGDYHTLAVPLGRSEPRSPLEVRPAREGDAAAVLAFLTSEGLRRQFFPAYREGELFSSAGPLMGLRPENLLLAFDGGRLVGTLGLWDLHPWKQTVVEGYSGLLGWVRPLAAMWARLRGLPSLPPRGEEMRYLCAALPVAESGDVIEAMLRTASSRRADPATHLMVGLHEADPLLPVARKFAVACYTTRLFVVCFEDGEERRRSLDGRPPYLELGSL
jgi:hypothetical protein